MSQSELGALVPADMSGTNLSSTLLAWESALHSMHSGTSRPSYAVVGMKWLDTTSTPWKVYQFDGTDDILWGYVNATDNTVQFVSGPVNSKTTAYTVTVTDLDICVDADAAGGDFTITLPTVASAGNGFEVTLRNTGASGIVTVDGNGAETIDGATTKVLSNQWDSITVRCDGTTWHIVSSHSTLTAITKNLDFANVTNETTVDGANDTVLMRDDSAGAIREVKVDDLTGGGGGSGAQVGDIKIHAGSTLETGWLYCDGQAVSRTTYSALFTEIGTTYGIGDGSTTFNLPDMRARAVAGVNHSSLPNGANGSYSTRNEADTTGAETHQLTTSEMPSHSHGGSVGIVTANGQGGGNPSLWNAGSTSSTGGDAAHNNMQPTIFVPFIIYAGV